MNELPTKVYRPRPQPAHPGMYASEKADPAIVAPSPLLTTSCTLVAVVVHLTQASSVTAPVRLRLEALGARA